MNPVAVDYAAACLQVADVPATLLLEDFFNIRNSGFNLIISNPPFIQDPDRRLYRDGGAHHGLELSVRIAKHALDLLAPGGCMLLYTGVAMTSDEKNPLLAELMPHFSSGNFRWFFEEIDPDIFSEELDQPEYEGIDRIAAIGLKIVRLG